MAKHVEYWVCELCGEEHTTEDNALKCERMHERIAKYKDVYEPGARYPEYIEVMYVNGTTHKYYAD